MTLFRIDEGGRGGISLPKILVDKLKPGMRLTQDVTNYRGEILLYAGIELKDFYIEKLRGLGIAYAQVESLEGHNKPAKTEKFRSEKSRPGTDGICKETQNQALEIVESILEEIEGTGQLKDKHILQTKKIVDDIIQEVVENRIIIENLEDYQPVNTVVDELITNQQIFNNVETIRTYDEYTFIHCVNVCVMSVIMGLAFRYDQARLAELGVGSLLHDIGKVKISKEIINKPGKLTEEERKEVEKHTEYTFEILRERQDISYLSALIAYEHHERFDGLGYPLGLKTDQIHEYAKIVAVADVYDALVTDRCYRPRMHSYQAAEIIQASSGTHFDSTVVKAFMDNIVIYPVGSPVELSNGTRGVVAKINKQMPARPVVIVFYDQNGNHLNKPQQVDLTENLILFINKVFTNQIN